MNGSHYYATVRAWAVIGGVEIPISAAQVNYELNAIPVAVVRIPLGRSTRNGATSPIHSLVNLLTTQTPAEIWVSLDGDPTLAAGPLQPPRGPFRLFSGFTAGLGYIHDQETNQIAVQLNHNLVLLNQGSAFSAASNPGNPANYSFGAAMRGPNDAGALNWTVLSQSIGYVTAANLGKDVWGSAFYPWFLWFASRDCFWASERGLMGDQSNLPALPAVKSLAPGAPYGVPCRPKSGIMSDVDIAQSIAADVSQMAGSAAAIANQTLWDLLVGNFCPNYMMAVCPRIDGALVVPYIAAYRGDGGLPFLDITADQVEGLDFHMDTPRQQRGWGILGSLLFRSGIDVGSGASPSGATTLGGWYEGRRRGTVMISEGPRWMSQLVSSAAYAAAFTPNAGAAVANTFNPRVGNKLARRPNFKKRATQIARPLLTAYAQMRFAQTAIVGRQGTLSGPFRVDVAPGTLVRVHGVVEPGLGAADGFGLAHYGDVLRVSFIVDAEGARAGTAMHLGNLRTDAENADDKTTVGAHPLYQRTFMGSPLVLQ